MVSVREDTCPSIVVAVLGFPGFEACALAVFIRLCKIEESLFFFWARRSVICEGIDWLFDFSYLSASSVIFLQEMTMDFMAIKTSVAEVLLTRLARAGA